MARPRKYLSSCYITYGSHLQPSPVAYWKAFGPMGTGGAPHGWGGLRGLSGPTAAASHTGHSLCSSWSSGRRQKRMALQEKRL